jgi:pimeloyl-ACP methyl ester carboxylesterase
MTGLGCGHSMGAVMMIEVQARAAPFAGLVLLGYGTGGLPAILPADVVEAARDPEWLRANLPDFVRGRFGTALQSPEAARAGRRGKARGSPSFHTDNADPDGKVALRTSAAALLTMPGIYSMFPGVSDRASTSIEAPVLVVTGTHDFVAADERLHQQFAKSRDVRIFQPPDTGHNLFIFPSRDESFAQIADWAQQFAEP